MKTCFCPKRSSYRFLCHNNLEVFDWRYLNSGSNLIMSLISNPYIKLDYLAIHLLLSLILAIIQEIQRADAEVHWTQAQIWYNAELNWEIYKSHLRSFPWSVHAAVTPIFPIRQPSVLIVAFSFKRSHVHSQRLPLLRRYQRVVRCLRSDIMRFRSLLVMRCLGASKYEIYSVKGL